MSTGSLDRIISELGKGDAVEAAPVHLWNPPFCGDIDIEIRRDGSWWHEGSAIKRLRMAKLFASILLLEGGDYFLVTPAEKVRIRVEDLPFFFSRLRREGRGSQGKLFLETTLGQEVLVDQEHPLDFGHQAEPHPTLRVRGNLFGLVSRSVFYELVELAELVQTEKGAALGVWSSGSFFELGEAE